jgi:glucokinase
VNKCGDRGALATPGDLVVDIGGTKVLAALVRDGVVLARTRLESGGLSAEELASRVVAAVREMVQREGVPVREALVAVPGSIDRATGVVVSAANLPFYNFPLKSVLSHGLDDVNVILEDDANCGAVGEASVGEASLGAPGAERDLVYITLSTGIGMGSVSGGNLLIGAHGYAGELGHVTVVPDGRLCGCGRRGCLEAYGSGRAIGSLGSELLASNSETLLRSVVTDPDLVTAEAVIAAAGRGDVDCLQIVDRAIALLKGAVRMVQLVLDPEVVVFGGGLMSSKFFGDRLLGAFHGGGGPDGKSPLVRAAHFGDDSVIVGGMCLLSAARETPLFDEARGPR